jgi:hypothetical protein
MEGMMRRRGSHPLSGKKYTVALQRILDEPDPRKLIEGIEGMKMEPNALEVLSHAQLYLLGSEWDTETVLGAVDILAHARHEVVGCIGGTYDLQRWLMPHA